MRCLIAAVIVVIVLSGSQAASRPIKPTWNRNIVTVVWHRVSPERIQKICGERALGYRVGCAKISKDPKRICHVYAPMPKSVLDEKRWAILGHEIGHCFLGSYHPHHQLKKGGS